MITMHEHADFARIAVGLSIYLLPLSLILLATTWRRNGN